MDWLAARALAWYDAHGRAGLPWQTDRTPYRVWVSEIMLQQTQVTTVIPYFERFMVRFPNVQTLARAELDEVLHHWTGLGYYARGRNLHAAAKHIADELDGELPRSLEALTALPGIGRSTAGAILASGFGMRAPILDGNARRVLARFHAEPADTTGSVEALWAFADAHTPTERVADYTQAIMDLGATLCVRSRPLCTGCPLAERCAALTAHDVTSYPAPRRRRDMPVKQARMFVITDPDGRRLLERRPPTGLWGGLWNPPERDRGYPLDALLGELGAPPDCVADVSELAPFRHTFTHFHLDIAPLAANVTRTLASVNDGERFRWYRADDERRIGLSAAAVRLLGPATEELA